MTLFSKITCILFALLVLTGNKAFSQAKDLAAQENKCVRLYSRLTSFTQANDDSVSFYSDKFEKTFTSLIRNNPATINYAFPKLKDSNFCRVTTSADGNFKIYSWDTWTGGTMHFFKEIYQWRSNGKVFTRVPEYEEGDPGGFCSKIYTVGINSKSYYLAVSNSILSTKDLMQSISVYSIEGSKLADTAQLFRTKTKKLNSINVAFDFFSVADRPERPVELITYDDRRKITYIPVVDADGKVTKKNILYQLKGSYFEFAGIETGKRQ